MRTYVNITIFLLHTSTERWLQNFSKRHLYAIIKFVKDSLKSRPPAQNKWSWFCISYRRQREFFRETGGGIEVQEGGLLNGVSESGVVLKFFKKARSVHPKTSEFFKNVDQKALGTCNFYENLHKLCESFDFQQPI